MASPRSLTFTREAHDRIEVCTHRGEMVRDVSAIARRPKKQKGGCVPGTDLGWSELGLEKAEDIDNESVQSIILTNFH